MSLIIVVGEKSYLRKEYLVLFLALAISLVSNADASEIVDDVMHCGYNESFCSCGAYCDNSDILSAEPNNTIDGCTDGFYSLPGSDFLDYREFVYDIRLRNLNTSLDIDFNGGDIVEIEAEILCSSESDTFYIFYKNSSEESQWKLVTSDTCRSQDTTLFSELQNFTSMITLDDAEGKHAVRVFVVYWLGDYEYACGYDHDTEYSDTDDITFDVLRKYDFEAPSITITSPQDNAIIEPRQESYELPLILSITDMTGVDKAFLNATLTDDISNETTLSALDLILDENDGSYHANLSIPAGFVGDIHITFFANDTFSENNHVNDYTVLVIFVHDSIDIDITSPGMLSLSNNHLATITVMIKEDIIGNLSTIKTFDYNNSSSDLLLIAEKTDYPDNTTLYTFDSEFPDGENTFNICIKGASTNEPIECGSIIFTIDSTPPEISVDLDTIYLNNQTVEFQINLSDYPAGINYYSIEILNGSDETILTESDFSGNNEENIVFETNLDKGNYTLSMLAADSLDNINVLTLTFEVIDMASPEINYSYYPTSADDLDVNKTISFSIVTHDESEEQKTFIEILLDDSIIINRTLEYFDSETLGRKTYHHHSLNFTPVIEGNYYFIITSLDASSNIGIKTFNLSIMDEPPISLPTLQTTSAPRRRSSGGAMMILPNLTSSLQKNISGTFDIITSNQTMQDAIIESKPSIADKKDEANTVQLSEDNLDSGESMNSDYIKDRISKKSSESNLLTGMAVSDNHSTASKESVGIIFTIISAFAGIVFGVLNTIKEHRRE